MPILVTTFASASSARSITTLVGKVTTQSESGGQTKKNEDIPKPRKI